jgi:hypothetical protein
MKAILIAACALVVCAGPGKAGKNAGVVAGLSWNSERPTGDLPFSSSTQMLYVRFDNIREWKGAEIDLVWSPAGATGCVEHVGTNYRTGSGGSCTFLNRGTTVPIVTDDVSGHLHVAWANNEELTGCSGGVGLVLQFDFSRCPSFAGCFALKSAAVLDGNNEVDVCGFSESHVTVAGGREGSCGTEPQPRKAATWGEIKATYGNR